MSFFLSVELLIRWFLDLVEILGSKVNQNVVNRLRTLILSIILFLPLLSFGQFDSLGLNSTWNKGSLLLNDNTVMNGYVRHNDKLRLIKFKRALDEAEELSFNEHRVVKMEYFDREHSHQRTFLCLNVEHEDGLKSSVLFEVILELHEFALLAKKFGVNPAIRERRDNNGASYQSKVGYEQFEKLFLVSVEGVADLVLVTSEFERDKGKPLALPSGTFYDQSVLKKYVGLKWDIIKRYMKENDLNPKIKSDLIAILNHYKSLDEDSVN